MAAEFIMPQLGLTMTEGTITKWFKNIGDKVAVGDILVEIETDKISNQMESTLEGVLLDILAPEGTIAPVLAAIAIIGKPGEKVVRAVNAAPQAKAVTAAVADIPAKNAAAPAGGERLKASPLAKKIAKDKGLDLALITGTGPGGRVVERDVLAFTVQSKVKASPLAAKVAAEHGVDLAGISKEGRIMKEDVLAAIPRRTAAAPAQSGPLTGIRKVISERLTRSWQTVPHVTLTVEADMSEAKRLRENFARNGIKISFTDIIARCVAAALVEFPMVNNSLIEGQIINNKNVNVGIAVALDNGLIVPVIRDADRKSLQAISAELSSLGDRARHGKLLPDDYTGGTFTISNLGMHGVDHFSPIINPPESAILGICRIVERPVVVNAAVTVRPMMNLCLSFDHRLIDGALAAQFMARVRQFVEQPLLLL
jgi:pyruvate dehydrogenase E2 component (dihydrolipoamide acetyltransferase)